MHSGWTAGDKAEYQSRSTGEWLPCNITDLYGTSLKIDVKEGWLDLNEVGARLRPRAGRPERAKPAKPRPQAWATGDEATYEGQACVVTAAEASRAGGQKVQVSTKPGEWLRGEQLAGTAGIDVSIPRSVQKAFQDAQCCRHIRRILYIF